MIYRWRPQHSERNTHLKVSFLIFSLTSQGPRATYSRNDSADTSRTRRRIFHILGRRVGSCTRVGAELADLLNIHGTYHSRRNPVHKDQPPKLLRCLLHLGRGTRFRRALVLVENLVERMRRRGGRGVGRCRHEGRWWRSTSSRRAAVGFLGYSPSATTALCSTTLSCPSARLLALDLFAVLGFPRPWTFRFPRRGL